MYLDIGHVIELICHTDFVTLNEVGGRATLQEASRGVSEP